MSQDLVWARSVTVTFSFKFCFNYVRARVIMVILDSQQTRGIYPMVEQCWANVVDGGPTLLKHWVDVSCLLGWTNTRQAGIIIFLNLKVYFISPIYWTSYLLCDYFLPLCYNIPWWQDVTQKTRGFDPMLFQCWPTAYGAGPTLKQHWFKSSCLLGTYLLIVCRCYIGLDKYLDMMFQ